MGYDKNDLITVEITDMGIEGEGIGKIDGFTLFIKDAVIGDTVQAKIMKSKKNYAYARLEKVLTPSPFRVEPVCGKSRQCGGCQIQALSYEKQLSFKQDKVINNLIRLGGFAKEEIDKVAEPIAGMENPIRYRNKAQYPVGYDKDGKIIVGFYAGRTHSIIGNTDCYLGRDENKDILNTILDYMNRYHVTAYREENGKGLVRHILIRTGFQSDEIMVCLVVNDSHFKELPHQKELISALCKISHVKSISISINTQNTNVIMGQKIICLYGEEAIHDKIRVRDMKKPDMDFTGEELEFTISPLSFYQVSPMQTEKLYSLALEYAGLTGNETVWDLYCGIGTISLFMATKAKKVYGVEIVPEAIEDAKKNAVRNGIKNAEFFVGKAEEVLPEFYEKNGASGSRDIDMSHPDVIVVDPPRKGCDEICLDTMLKMQPKKIVYVSCDSATLARDLRILCDGGYELKRVRPVDQFAQTVHVETCVLLIHKSPDSCINIDVDFGEGAGKISTEKIAERANKFKPKDKVTY